MIQDIYRRKRFSPEAHHIIPRRHGGRNTLKNGITLCRFCHNYFDLLYLETGQDYLEAIERIAEKKRLWQVMELLRKRYISYLRWKMIEEDD